MGSAYSVPTAFADTPKDDPPPNAPFTPLTPHPTPSPSPNATKPGNDMNSSVPESASDAEAKSAETPSAPEPSDASSPTSTWGGHRADIANPGTFEELSADATQILRPNVVDGLSFNFNAPLSESFAVGTALDMGAKTRPPSFALNANYFNDRVVLLSRTSPADGRVSARAFVTHSPALVSKIVADVSADTESNRLSYDLDVRSARSCTSFKAATGRMLAANHVHALTPRVAVGGELLCQLSGGLLAATVGGKYEDGGRVVALSAATFGPVVLSYVRKVSPKARFAAEVFVDASSNESHVTAGYRFDLSSATVTGTVDSGGKVSATLEERINPALTLALSGELDHAKGQQNFGIGVSIGGA